MEYPQWREYLTVLEVMCEELDKRSLEQSSLKDTKSDFMEDEAEESEDNEDNEDGSSSNVQANLITDFFKGAKETKGKEEQTIPAIPDIPDIPSVVCNVKLDIDASLFMKYQRLSRLFKRKKNQMVCRVSFVDFQNMCKYLTLIVENLELDIHSKNGEDASDANEEISEEDAAEMQEECKDLEDYTAELKQVKPKRKRKDKPGWLITDDESSSSASSPDGKKRKRIRRT